MLLVNLLCILFGSFLCFFGGWFTFLTIVNVFIKGKYTLFVLLLASLLFSLGVTLFMIGVLI